MLVKPKKSLAQHFLKDKNIAKKIVQSIQSTNIKKVLEIGPGMGILTQFLVENKQYETFVIEIDNNSVEYLKQSIPQLKDSQYINKNFLKFDLKKFFNHPIAIIGNFPYNISSQILFQVLQNRDIVVELVGMFQKEVAERICSKHGNKTYGILSVLLQAFYNIEYLFTVNEKVFYPPPKVKSAVIRMIRNNVKNLNCNEELFFKIVKTGFNQRRKTLRNSLKTILNNQPLNIDSEIFSKRAEQLNVEQFVELTNLIDNEIQINKKIY